MRPYRDERSRYIPDGADYLARDTQFRRRASPEKIARRRSDNREIRAGMQRHDREPESSAQTVELAVDDLDFMALRVQADVFE